MKILPAHFTCLICSMTASLSLIAQEPLEQPDQMIEPVSCTKEELINFFPQQIVEHVLIKAKIPKEQAKKIAIELSQKNMELSRIVEEKSLQAQKNPQNGSNLHDQTIKIYGDTLHEMFSKVLSSHGIKNEVQEQVLLEQIRVERSKHFIECIRRQQSNPPASPDNQ